MKYVLMAAAVIGAFVIGRVSAPEPAAPSMTMEHAMVSMSGSLEGKEGDAFDRAFATQMILHHEGAIEMAELALVHAQRDEVKELARGIIAAQASEIELMRGWQATWK